MKFKDSPITSLARSCFTSLLRSQYGENRSTLYLNQYFLLIRLQDYPKAQVLPGYILPISRRPRTGVDNILYITDRDLRSLAIKWRRNTLGINFIFSVFFKAFTRGHLFSCFFYLFPPICYPLDLVPAANSANYTYLDYLLNLRSYNE